jgi:hypothetical protein
MMANQGKIRRVAIIGTGIAGLGMGACLKQLRTGVEEIVIFERYGDLLDYNKGGALNISGGSVVLDLLGASTDLQKISNKVDQIVVSHDEQNIVNLDLTKMRDIFPSFMCEEGGKGDPMVYLVRWSMLRKLLYDIVNENKHQSLVENPSVMKGRDRKGVRLEAEQEEETKEIHPPVPLTRSSPMSSPSITIQSRHKFSYLKEDDRNGKVTLFFEDGSSEGNFDLVIGADGVRSTVRHFTSLPNETIISRVPIIGSLLGNWSKGNHNTGLRVGQCITPLRGLLSKGKGGEGGGGKETTRGERDIDVGFAGRDTREREEMGDKTSFKAAKGRGKSEANLFHNGDGQRTKGPELISSSSLSSSVAVDKGKEDMNESIETVDEVLSNMKHLCAHELHLWIGDHANILTCNVGNGDNLHNVLLSIYREKHGILKDHNPSWEQHKGDKIEIKSRLNESGFNNYHDLHTLLDATTMTGGQIFDVGVRDTLFPLSTWSSDSGRVILIGDAAHTM